MTTTPQNPAIYNDLVIIIGCDWYQPFTITSNGTPLNLTGYTAEMVIKDAKGGNIIQDCADFITIPSPTTGVILIQIPHATTNTYTERAGVYDLTMTSGSIIFPLLTGVIALERMS